MEFRLHKEGNNERVDPLREQNQWMVGPGNVNYLEYLSEAGYMRKSAEKIRRGHQRKYVQLEFSHW